MAFKSHWGGHGGQAGPLQRSSQGLPNLPPRASGHLPTAIPCAVHRTAHGQQDNEEEENIHHYQQHVAAARTRACHHQCGCRRTACRIPVAWGSLGCGADVTECLVPGAGRGGGGGGTGGNRRGSKQDWRQKLGLHTPDRALWHALLARSGWAGPVAGSSAWLPALPANSSQGSTQRGLAASLGSSLPPCSLQPCATGCFPINRHTTKNTMTTAACACLGVEEPIF